jgi:hypothetical protein
LPPRRTLVPTAKDTAADGDDGPDAACAGIVIRGTGCRWDRRRPLHVLLVAAGPLAIDPNDFWSHLVRRNALEGTAERATIIVVMVSALAHRAFGGNWQLAWAALMAGQHGRFFTDR